MTTVSVIIPAYNAADFIERTLASVLSQTYRDIEVIVVDDGSQDQTAEIVKSIAEKDSRVVLCQQQNQGVAAARNFGIQQSKGELIAPIDADDIWYAQNLEKQVQCLLNAPDSVGLVYSWSIDINQADQPIGNFRASKITGNVYKTLICHNFIGNASATLIRRSCLEKVGGYNTELKAQNAQGCEDWDLYLRIAESYEFRVVPEFLVGYRKISHSMSGDYTQMAKSHHLMLQTVRQNHPEIPAVLYQLSSSSFYMYFAQQSHQASNGKQTLFWLYQAVKNDWITPWFRYGFYTLSLKSVGKIIGDYFARLFSQQQQKGSEQLRMKRGNDPPPLSSNVPDVNPRKLSISFKLFVGNLLHHSLLII